MEHLYDKLIAYSKTDMYPYHMPGHKRRLHGSMPSDIFEMDITEIDGFDNLHQPEEIIAGLQERAARLYGADKSYYLVNGSTCGILSAISAALPEGGHILMSRNSHKSAYHAAYLRNLQITYLHPPMVKGFDYCDAVTPLQVEKALEAQQDIQAVFIVSPTYEGRIADVKAIAGIVHAKGIPLIVDEAHGAHLGFAEGFADNSNRAGADLVIHSVHKTLPSLTQTALLHCNGDLINREKLERFLHIYQSSSPSYLLMASIDNALHTVETQGKELFRFLRENYINMLKQLKTCYKLRIMTEVSQKQDIGKLIIDCRYAGISGKQLYDMLSERYHLQLEMVCQTYCLAMFTVGDSKEAFERMTQALLQIDSELQGEREVCEEPQTADAFLTDDKIMQTNHSIPLAEAWNLPWEVVSLQQAVDRRVADFINLYPPGVPLLVPGEVLTKNTYEKLQKYLAQGLNVQGIQMIEGLYLLKCVIL